MTKEEILNGMSEEEFYRLYPTRESWEAAQAQMAYGGSPYIMGVPFGTGITMAHGGTYYGGPIYPAAYGGMYPTGGENDVPLVTSVPKGYVPSKDRPGYYEMTTPVPGRVKPGNIKPSSKPTTDPGAYQNAMMNMVKSGKVSVEQLLAEGKITQDFAKTLAPYSKKQYVRLQPPTGNTTVQTTGVSAPQKTGIPLKDSDKIDRKQIWTSGNQNQYYDTFLYPHVDRGYSDATTRYFDKKTGRPINPGKSFDDKGNYIASFVEETPGAEGTLKQTRINTSIGSATDNPVTRAYSAGFRYGGLPGGPYEMPCYGCGGYMEDGGNSTPYGYGAFPAFAVGGMSQEEIHEARQKPGGSNVGKKTFADGSKRTGPYAGPSGGAPQGSYPSFNYGGYDHGGDVTSQGGNEDFLGNRNDTYLNYIKNNVIKNLHQEESQKVMNAFMQMENSYPINNQTYMQGGGSYYDMINPQNTSLQNMYANQINQLEQQHAQDKAGFKLRNFFNLPEAAEGTQQSTHSNFLHQLAAEFGPSSRRTGLPLFPGNMSPYYGIGKKDAQKLVGVPQGFKMEGLEITPKYGLLGRTKLGRYMGIGPKSIHYKFTGKHGYLPGEPQPDESKGQYGPAPAGTIMTATESKMPYNPESNPGPGAYNWNMQLPKVPVTPAFPQNTLSGPRASQMLNESDPMQGFIPKQIFMQSQLQPHAYGGNYFDGGGPTLNMPYGNPIKLQNTTNQYSFVGQQPTPDYKAAAGFKSAMPDNIVKADESKNSPYEQSPRVMYDPTKDRSQEEISIEGDLKRKWQGVGETIGQWAIPAMNKFSSMLEQKDYKKAKKKLEESMLADNTFRSSPLNAKNRGDYDLNSGMFRPDQMVPVQFPGYAQWGGFNTMAFGGAYEEGEELDLSPEEIEDLRQQGYEIEELD